MGNPITRKATYRPLLISKCPRLSIADGLVGGGEGEGGGGGGQGHVPAPPHQQVPTTIYCGWSGGWGEGGGGEGLYVFRERAKGMEEEFKGA